MDFLFKPKSPLIGFLDPLSLIKLLHVSKQARKAAVSGLKAFQEEPQTAGHNQMFQAWLDEPSFTESNHVFREMRNQEDPGNVAGNLRIESILNESNKIRKNVVLLRYQKTFENESSTVALFDDNGVFVAIYELGSHQFYEGYVDRAVMSGRGRTFNSRGGSNFGMPSIWISTSASLILDHGTMEHDCWSQEELELTWEWDGFLGCVGFCNYALIELFRGKLSPTEAVFALMHALSSDTRAIFVSTLAVFDTMHSDIESFREDGIEWMELENPRQVSEMIEQWKDSLPGV